ncbi:hypothetical protein PMN44_10215 [Bifidobacterium longum]|uniref:hypothetical protein n=1 Tax=Bifidobacterium longum TaxID=216816 RepID=UPI001E3CF7B2|nr:hypothetical protein [Bifidobacterium longum]MDB6542602.1 hypothetical protein [Bifidobacterium longum]MDB6546542.1 hypothetical protein [Bifidobacterium longum]MDB6550848.1 hypothetical protein [Bifidobacterium longum]MDB6553044.1 hypothetical protein [Bifidobacterium longum]MDB6555126.1 hypothetical protein [Bifidobacterium longum]
MTSGGGTFSPEEIKYLKSLSAVAEATAKRITYTDDFKRYCVVHYNEGASPVRMFREAGLDPALIGYKRIERCLARWRDSAESSLPAGTGSESDFHVSPERRAIIFPVSRKEQNNDLRDLLISQQVRRIDELERQVDMLEALLHGRRRKEQAANTLPEEQTDTAADKSPDTDGQQQ